MKLLSCAIGLLFLSCGVVEAGELSRAIYGSDATAYEVKIENNTQPLQKGKVDLPGAYCYEYVGNLVKVVPCKEKVRGGTEGRAVLRNDRSSAPVAARAVTQAGYPLHGQPVSSPVPSPKKVIFDYDDVIRIMADKEHRDKLLNQCAAERAILLKLKDEQGKTISIQADQVKGLIETAETQERLGKTEAQINEALQKQLNKVVQDLDREKRLSRYKSEAFYLGAAIVLWVVN